ncbi:MAG: tetratricopeptide repeat protein [Gammaproteobacteria bacterium]|jgi:TolB-like protein/class 3 adenylate cyclase/predicted negative regulator of RcsB-dependent stress response|nr:tetratricopeptide repeat protein [Gammaproteobacteria bacterium]
MAAAANRLTPKMAVILHADVVGSTTLVQLDEALAHERIRKAFQRLSELVSTYGGTTHEVRGDALLAEFSRASDAVSAALRFQSDNVDTNAGLEDDVRVEVRIGISLGEVIIADGTLTGPDVVLAQRLEQLASANGVCVSENVQQSVPRRLPFTFDGLGEQALKGFDYVISAYTVSLSAGASIPKPHAISITVAARGRRRLLALMVTTLLLFAAGAWWWRSTSQMTTTQTEIALAAPERMAFPLPDKPSIAVLPLTNMSEDASQDYFADGMTEDLITDLSKLSGLFVIARNSTFTYKGQAVNISRVAEELGVRYVLEGSVRRVGEQVRINAQLIDAVSGGHLWAERYDGDAADVFALQDRITAAIVQALSVTLLAGERQALANKDTGVPAAHDALLVGWAHMQSKSLESLAQAKAAFEKAVALDPEYARSWAALVQLYYQANVRAYSAQLGLEMNDVPALLEKSLARPSPEAYDAQLWWLSYQARMAEMPAVIDHMAKLDPNYAGTYAWRGALAAFDGDPDSAIAHLRSALRLSPNSAHILASLGRVYIQMGRYQEAVNLLEQAKARDPDDPRFIADLAAAYALAGRTAEGQKTAARLVERRKASGYALTLVAYFGRSSMSHPDYREHLREGLRLAGVPEEVKAEDLNLLHEHRLSGVELRELNKDGVRTMGEIPGGQWMFDRLADGTGIHYWLGEEYARSDWRIEGDQLMVRYRPPSKREPYRCDVYRNPAGARETLDEYIAICTIGVHWYARLPLPRDSQ